MTPDGRGEAARYRVSALTDRDGALLLRTIACLGRHCIEIESFRCETRPADTAFEHEFIVRTMEDRMRRAAMQIRATVGVARVDYCSVEDDVADSGRKPREERSWREYVWVMPRKPWSRGKSGRSRRRGRH